MHQPVTPEQAREVRETQPLLQPDDPVVAEVAEASGLPAEAVCAVLRHLFVYVDAAIDGPVIHVGPGTEAALERLAEASGQPVEVAHEVIETLTDCIEAEQPWGVVEGEVWN